MSKKVERRVVTTDALETLGTIHTKEEKRDAIHLAVEPVKAGEPLEPGAHVRVIDGVAKTAPRTECQGIVNHSSVGTVRKGSSFWFVMYPGMVHSLRHVWVHPDFPDVPEVSDDGEPQGTKRVAKRALDRAKAFITEHADALNLSYADLMEHADEYVRSGNYYVGGAEAEGYVIPEEFWEHWEMITGRTVSDGRHRGNFISCSC